MTDQEFAAYIDKVFAVCNHSDMPAAAQFWTPEMIIEMYVSFVGAKVDLESMSTFLNHLTAGAEPEDDSPTFHAAIREAKAAYWRGKMTGRSN